MKIIAIANQKGGEGKTTTTTRLAQALRRHARPPRVLVIDLDAQRDATDLLAPGLDAVPGTLEVLCDGVPLSEVLVTTKTGVQLCPASIELAGLDVLIGTRRDGPSRLRAALAAAGPLWDFVFLDCPPALGQATVNALVAADAVLTPITAAGLSIKAIGPLSTSIGQAVVHNPALRHLGFLLTKVNDREAVTGEIRVQIRGQRLPSASGPPLWNTEIPVDTRLKAIPVRRGRGVIAYEAAAAEFLRRVRRLDAERSSP